MDISKQKDVGEVIFNDFESVANCYDFETLLFQMRNATFTTISYEVQNRFGQDTVRDFFESDESAEESLKLKITSRLRDCLNSTTAF